MRSYKSAVEEHSGIVADKGFAICTTPRSGSNLLSQWCASTNKLGRPLEYFNYAGRRIFDWSDYPDDVEQQIGAILGVGTTPNGVYALKLFPDQFDLSISSKWTLRLPDLRFVYLERRDKLAQAVSWARAIQTQQFRKNAIATGTPAYSRELIATQLSTIVKWHGRWQLYFARNGIRPLFVTYEDLELDPAACVQRVGELMEVTDLRLNADEISVERQRDEISEAWQQCFIKEAGDLTWMDLA